MKNKKETTQQSLQELIKEYKDRVKNGLIVALRYNQCATQELISLTDFLDEDSTVSTRIYCVLNDVKERPTCECGKQLRFHKLDKGFFATCGDTECVHNLRSKNSAEHAKHIDWELAAARSRETNMKRYGGLSSFCKSSSLHDKQTKTMKERYGVEHPLQNKELLQKQQRTTIERHGTLDMIHTDKVSRTMVERYGTMHAMQNVELASRSAANSVIVKNEKLNARIKKMNLSKLSYDDGYYSFKCNTCGNTVTHISRPFINFAYLNEKSPCQTCFPEYYFRSEGEKELKGMIEEFLYKGEIKCNAGYLGASIDIMIPEKKLCIEYNGVYWHSELHKPKNHHVNKKRIVENEKYDLVYIWEDDWKDEHKSFVIMNMLSSKMGITPKISVKECDIRNVCKKDADEFINKYYLYENKTSNVRLGLYYKNELSSIVNFKKCKNEYVITCHCDGPSVDIIDGFNSIIKYFINNYSNKLSITVNCDWTPSYDSVYERTGFSLVKHTKPTIFWNVKGKKTLYKNFKKNKDNISDGDVNKSEFEVMHAKKLYSIENAGNLIFKYNSKKGRT